MSEFTKEFKADTFSEEVINSSKPVLVDFLAEWCGPCKMLTPTIDELATKYGQNAILMNYEFRLPFFMYYVPTIEFLGQIFGIFFVDIGVVWDDDFPKYSDESSWINPAQPLSSICNEDDCSGWLMSYGFGPRFILFGMPWKLDYAWQYNPHKGKISNRKWYISIGFDF